MLQNLMGRMLLKINYLLSYRYSLIYSSILAKKVAGKCYKTLIEKQEKKRRLFSYMGEARHRGEKKARKKCWVRMSEVLSRTIG